MERREELDGKKVGSLNLMKKGGRQGGVYVCVRVCEVMRIPSLKVDEGECWGTLQRKTAHPEELELYLTAGVIQK